MPVYRQFCREIPSDAWTSLEVRSLYEAVGAHDLIGDNGEVALQDAEVITSDLRDNFPELTQDRVLEVAASYAIAVRYLSTPLHSERKALIETLTSNGSSTSLELVLVLDAWGLDQWESLLGVSSAQVRSSLGLTNLEESQTEPEEDVEDTSTLEEDADRSESLPKPLVEDEGSPTDSQEVVEENPPSPRAIGSRELTPRKGSAFRSYLPRFVIAGGKKCSLRITDPFERTYWELPLRCRPDIVQALAHWERGERNCLFTRPHEEEGLAPTGQQCYRTGLYGRSASFLWYRRSKSQEVVVFDALDKDGRGHSREEDVP